MERKEKIGAVAVVGAGIGGIQASLQLAESGYKVYLVEKTPAIGGTMAQLDKTFPTNDCAMCILSPKLVECGRHLNIEILTCSEVLDIKGEPGNFEVEVLKHPRYIKLENCTGCGDCANACPVELPSEFDQGLGLRKAVYRPFAQAFPSAFAISKRGRAPCKAACPAGVDVQGYVALISKGKFNEALALIKETLPLPGVLGRVCTHPCEGQCNRGAFDQAVSICSLKRFVADHGEDKASPPVEVRPEKVAIVGSGPAGLAAAYFLARNGCRSTIFEALPVAGGMLAVGIPEYRLPRAVLKKEIEGITRLGVEIRTNIRVGKDVSVDDLFRQGFGAIFIATGAHGSQKQGIPGENAECVLTGVEFLRDLNLAKPTTVGARVGVVGGGNVAIDAARSALRLGAKDVILIYRRTKAEMPASPQEVEAAEQEGVKLMYLANPTAVLESQGRVSGVRCIRMKLGEPDSSGRRRPEPVPGSEFNIPLDTLIMAIGQTADTSFAATDSGLSLDEKGNLVIAPETLATSREGVFAGGDLESGPATVVAAIAAGHKAAISIMSYLAGRPLEEPAWQDEAEPVPATAVPPPEKRQERVAAPELPVEKRRAGFNEVELGLAEESAVREAQRCLNCGICSECLQCVAACKASAIDHNMKEETVKLNVGSVILSPGFEKFNPSVIKDYGYGKFANVLTSAEFERVLSASGPFQGHLVRPSDHKQPRRIAWLQCVGSRDVNVGHEYCSSVCCTYAIKEAIVAREHAVGDLDITIFFMDIRTFGKGFEDYYTRAKDEYKVRFVKSKVYRIEEKPETGNLDLRYTTETGELTHEEFDLAVLSVGFQPSAAAMEMAKHAGLDLNRYGFCQTKDFSLVESSRPGIFASGAFQGPRDIPETVVQASAAAASSAALLSEARNTGVREKEYPDEIDISAEEPRIGVFICHCGLNIGGIVNVPSVREHAAGLPNVVYADDNMYTCSQDTQKKIKEKIAEHRLNRVVVASCSPRTHEPLFQETIREAGLNRYLFEMANIRDQCSWVHQREPEKATQKSRDLVRMAVARASRLEPLHKVALGLSHDALVIGGGVAGLTAALNLAQQGFRTCVVEREKTVGGWARKVYTSPDGKDVQEYLRSLISAVEGNELIEVLTGATIAKTDGFIGNFRTTVSLDNGTTQRLIEHGVIVVATGGTEYRGDEFSLGQNERIVTLTDFEERLTPIGQRMTDGHAVPMQESPEALSQAKNVVITLCVRPPGLSYCSRVCCTSAIKNALRLREINPQANIYVLYKDIRTYGFKEELYTKAREQGILFVHYTDEKPPKADLASGKLTVEFFEPILNATVKIEPDLLVLANPLIPAASNKDISGILKVPLNKDGFFHEAHVKLAPVDFASEGIFMAGTAHAPKFIDESIAQALAAAGRAGTILAKKQLEVGGPISEVDAKKCKACLTCVRMCPYDIPRINKEGVAEIDAAKCHGCGVCAAECPRKAIKLMHYREEQMVAKTEALFA